MNKNHGDFQKNEHAIVTGGSSGIGLATACKLASKGVNISILARTDARLQQAKKFILEEAPRAVVQTVECDVRSLDSCQRAVEMATSSMGPPSWAIASAGIVVPGIFEDMDLADHIDQIQTNYMGSVYFARAVIPSMKRNGGGRIVFLGSGAGLIGVYGYSAYAPSKFAVRGLAEVLRVELEQHNISITLVNPPDTRTPQLLAERVRRPKATEVIAGRAGVWEPESVASQLIEGALRRKFSVTLGFQLRLIGVLHPLIGPLFRIYQQSIVRRIAMRQ